MSVKRYTNGADDDQGTILPFMEESPNGDYVEYSDYAALLAEVERLKGIILAQSSDFVRSKTADDGIKPEGHNDLAGRAVERCLELKAEIERLRKAGDAMANWFCPVAGVKQVEAHIAYDAWNDAKEGKPS